MEPIFNASSIHLRSRSSLRDQWDRLTHLADRTPQINAAMQAAATFDRPPPPCSPPRRRVGWTQAELEVLHEGVAQGKGPTAIHRDLVARFTASERTLSSVRRRLDKVPKAAGRSNDEEAEEDDDSEENDDRDSGLPAEASNPSRQPQSSGQVTASPSFSVTTMQRAAAAAHSLGYGHTISRPRREGERTSGASPTSSHKRKRGGQQHGSSWTAREDRVLRACMARGSSGWASFEEVRKGYFKSFPSATRTDSALKVRRSALHRARGRHVSHVSGREEGEEESDEDNPSDEGRHEGVNARQADGEGEDQSQSQSNGVDAAEYSARRTEEIEAEWGGEDDDFGGEAIMDGLPAGDDEVMQTGSGRQLSLSRRLQRPVEAAHDEEGYASHFDRSQTMEPNTQSSNTRTLGEDQQVALQLSAAPPDVQRVSVPLPPSLQTQQAAASSAAAVTPSSETGIPQLLFEPSGVRAKACVAGMEVMIFAHGSAWMSMRGAAMDTTPPFSALPPFHFKILAHGQVQQVRMPPNIMVSVVPRVRDSQAAAEGATSGMSLEWRFVGPEGLTVVLEC